MQVFETLGIRFGLSVQRADAPCADAPGSINDTTNPEGVNNPPYVAPNLAIGDWTLGGTDECATNETINQATYAAENLNINGAPLRVYKLLGIHEQGNGSITQHGVIYTSTAAPGYPASNINSSAAWRSLPIASLVAGNAFIAIEFGNRLSAATNQSLYDPPKPDWQTVGAVSIQQVDSPNGFARQLRVDISDGTILLNAPTWGSTIGTLSATIGSDAQRGIVVVTFTSSTDFTVLQYRASGTVLLGYGNLSSGFSSTVTSFSISGSFSTGDTVSYVLSYKWSRVGIFNVVQSGSPVVLNLQKTFQAKVVRVVPTLFTGSGSWEVSSIDVLDSPPSNINNIQDLFFNENRDRDYSKVPLIVKAQYQINNSIADLSRFGLSILDQYSFVVSYPVMVQLLGRPIVTGDIIEVIPEMQYDHNLKAVRKFLEVTDTGWAAEGYSTSWKPTLYRFAAQQALPSQETRDIFGTIDTQKYVMADNFFNELGAGEQIDTTPLTDTEEIAKLAKKATPEIGDDFALSTDGAPLPPTMPPVNAKGQPPAIPAGNNKQGYALEDGMPPNGDPYGEGYKLPDPTSATDGDWFRLYYPDHLRIPARLYRFSAVKNKWIFMETDRRGDASSLKPSIQKIMNSPTRVGLEKKQV